ncbi:MAG: sigma-70 family RNA polymerase sigma factor [Treponema sp.]|jgi:RNA polymerase sigma-70 factor (ECF subfamily)|nr:sigma-70 family RNA polymerase sigma factor [Treponema sp.]
MKPDNSGEAEKKQILKRDTQLIKECFEGNNESFAKLISFYQNRVRAVGIQFFRNQTDTEDFMQEVFIKVYKNLSSFRGESSFATWITRIAYTTAINAKNAKKDCESLAEDVELKSSFKTPEEEQLFNLTKEAVREAIKELPLNYSICLDFYFFYDFSYEEIAIITGFPVNTIKSHIFRAKKVLRQKLLEYSYKN